MKKRARVVLLILMLIASMSLFLFACDKDGGNNGGNNAGKDNEEVDENYQYITFKLSEDKTYYIITDASESRVTGHLVIPSSYRGKPVKEIGVQAFARCNNVTSLEIPGSVTTIDDRAFISCEKI